MRDVQSFRLIPSEFFRPCSKKKVSVACDETGCSRSRDRRKSVNRDCLLSKLFVRRPKVLMLGRRGRDPDIELTMKNCPCGPNLATKTAVWRPFCSALVERRRTMQLTPRADVPKDPVSAHSIRDGAPGTVLYKYPTTRPRKRAAFPSKAPTNGR